MGTLLILSSRCTTSLILGGVQIPFEPILQRKIYKSALFLLLFGSAMSGSSLSRGQAAVPSGNQIQAHLAQAQRDLTANAPEHAISEFKAVLAIDKDNATALANLGALTYLQGDCARAVPYLQHALKLEPTFSKTKGLLAICQRMMGDPSAQSVLDSFVF
jgi:Flp pilus assembly protein TadD